MRKFSARRLFISVGFTIHVLSGAACAQTATAFYDPSPLTEAEHLEVLEILRAESKVNSQSRFTRLSIAPEIKSNLAHPRRAEVNIKQARSVYEGVVNLDKRSIESWQLIDGAHAPWLNEEFFSPLVDDLKAHPEFVAALKARGIESTDQVSCMFTPPAFFGEEKFESVRLAVARCHPVGNYTNKYPRRIEGLQIFADMDAGKILEVNDYEVIPVPETYADYASEVSTESALQDEDAPPTQLKDAPLSIANGLVEWDNWRFHIRSDQRVGIVISKAHWKDGEEWRSVLNEGHLSEISVPYQAPQGDWYLRSPIDAGEYSAGGLSDPLIAGVHCPEDANFIDALIVDDDGSPELKSRVICVFERSNGDPGWLHDVEGRQEKSLIARMSARLGNYDYIVDWVFGRDGQIQVRLGATGIVATMNTRQQNANAQGDDDAFGRFVDDHVVAINHSHYFNFRFDLDIDETENNFHHGKVVPRALADKSPRKSIWVFEEDTVSTETEGKLSGHDIWRVGSKSRKNALGYPTSYQIMAGMNARPKIDADDWPRARAGFVDNVLWVTRRKPRERFAAGDYPTQSSPGQGLPDYSDGESIASADLVVWYTMGMHHVVRSEDWPVMPVLWHTVSLRPFDFFDRNPAVGLVDETRPQKVNRN